MAESERRARPRDTNQLAKLVADIATGTFEDREKHDRYEGRDPYVVALSGLGGKRGGGARSRARTPEQRRNIARRAAAASWAKDDD